jgi:RES domain-containing protein
VDTPWLPPDRPAPGEARYHRAGDSWPLYASLDADTAWAEWRGATRGAIDPTTETRRMWRLDVRDLRVIDLRSADVRAALGVGTDDLVGGRRACHALARRARDLGADGLIVPSAARDGGWNLVVFPRGFPALHAAGSSVRNRARRP